MTKLSMPILIRGWLMLMVLLITGCDEEDERVRRLAEQTVAQQAAQNQEMARLNREVAEGTQRVITANAEVRQEILAAQRDLQRQQADVHQQRDVLEQERKTIAKERRNDSVLAPIVATFGTALLCLLPVGMACCVLWQTPRSEPAELSELLIADLVSARPRLLPSPGTPPAMPPRRLEPPPAENSL